MSDVAKACGAYGSEAGGSLRDEGLAGHVTLAMTQRYSEGDTEATRQLIALM